MAVVRSGTGIDMGNNPESTVLTLDSVDVVDKAYVSRASIWLYTRTMLVACNNYTNS